jgi:hypothetical protein
MMDARMIDGRWAMRSSRKILAVLCVAELYQCLAFNRYSNVRTYAQRQLRSRRRDHDISRSRRHAISD